MPTNSKNKEISKSAKAKTSHGTMVAAASRFSGPLPPPQLLKGYEEICSGAANRIIKMAESQSKHRQTLEKSVITSNIENEKIGMWMTFSLTILLMGFGIYLLINDKNIIAFLAIFGPVIFHAGNYVYNKKREEKVPEKSK